MQIQKIITPFLLLAITIALYFVFSHTKASPLTFLLGALLCIVVEAVCLCFYCCYKIHQTYRQAQTIKLRKNYELDPRYQYPFETVEVRDQFFFNKYTDEAKYFSQKNQLSKEVKQATNNEDDYFEEFEINLPKNETMTFLREIEGYYSSLNIFTDVLVNFGKDLKYIDKSSIFEKKDYFFPGFQKNYPPEVPMNELKQKEVQVFGATNTNPLRTKSGEEKILFPTWAAVIDLLRYIGSEFQKIQAMRRSNSQMLTMIHKKVLEDLSLLQNKLTSVGKELYQSSKNLKDLRREYAKHQKTQFNVGDENQPHLEMMQWFKRQYYAFRDLERRIKEKEAFCEEMNKQKKYYQEKLSSFKKGSQKAYMKTVKTRYIALLDSYHITVDESIKKIQESFRNYEFPSVPHRPKVKDLAPSKNLNEALEAEREYQKEYFKRVQYFQDILKGMMASMESMGEFLNHFRSVFGEMVKNLKASLVYKPRMAKYFTDLTKILLQRALALYYQVCQLVQVNQRTQKLNTPQLLSIKQDIQKNIDKATKILAQISLNQGPIRHKFHSARQQIESIYHEIEQKITKIQEFESLYILHSSRIKKIIVIEMIDFLNNQRQFIAIGNIKENFSSTAYGLIDETENPDEAARKMSEKKTDYAELELDEEEGLIAQKCELSPTYIKFINQFLFVCYTEWKTSNFFKSEIQQELFIAFNKDPNESFSKIEVSEMEFFGLPPQIVWFKQLRTESTQAFFDVHLAFKGTVKFKVNTIYKLIRDIPVEVVIEIQQFYCVMRFCFVPSYMGKGWFSFIGQPIAKFKIVPSIANYRFDIETLRSMFNSFLMNKLKKNTYPIKQKMLIPASKKDDDLAVIEKRFKVIQEMEAYR